MAAASGWLPGRVRAAAGAGVLAHLEAVDLFLDFLLGRLVLWGQGCLIVQRHLGHVIVVLFHGSSSCGRLGHCRVEPETSRRRSSRAEEADANLIVT